MFILTHVLISEISISGSIFFGNRFSIGGHTDAMFPPSSNFQNLFPLKKSDFVGFPVLRTISRKMSFPKFESSPIITGAFSEWKFFSQNSWNENELWIQNHKYAPNFNFSLKMGLNSEFQSFQFRWLKIKGIHAAFPSLITLLSHHLK